MESIVSTSIPMNWEDLEKYIKLQPISVYNTGLPNQQGMACDGTYFYVTHRNSNIDTVPMRLAKINKSTMSVVDDQELGQGHFNSLYYYNNKIYATEPVINSATNKPDDRKIAVISPSSLSITTIKDLPVDAWGFGTKRFSDTTGPVSAMYLAASRSIDFYAGYYVNNSSKQYPLTRVTLDYTGCETVQGTFHMTANYIWVIRTAYNNPTRASGHQVIACYSYSGMTVKEFYIDSETYELQDIYVEDNETTIYANTVDGRILKFEIDSLYHTVLSGINGRNVLLPGTVKHVYSNPSPEDDSYPFTYNTSTYYVYSVIVMSDFMYKSEIADFMPIFISINGKKFQGMINQDLSKMTFQGVVPFANGDRISFYLEFSLGLTQHNYNYKYTLTKAEFYTVDYSAGSSGIQYYSETSTDGDLSDLEHGIGLAFKNLYNNGWLNGHIYIHNISYICGNRYDYTPLNVL